MIVKSDSVADTKNNLDQLFDRAFEEVSPSAGQALGYVDKTSK
jgi:hypothetical protein